MHGKLWMSSFQWSWPCLIQSYNLRYRTWKDGDAKLKYSGCFFLKNSHIYIYIYISSNSKQISLSPFDENQLRYCQGFRYFGDISYVLTLILACKLLFERKKYALRDGPKFNTIQQPNKKVNILTILGQGFGLNCCKMDLPIIVTF